MGFIVSIIILLLGIIQQKNKKTWTSPDVIFCYLWGIVTFAASLRLYGLYAISEKTWLIILVGVIAFCMGTRFTVTVRRKNPNLRFDESTTGDTLYYISSRLFWILFLVVAVLLVRELRTSIQLLQQGYSLAIIRDASYGLAEIKGYTANSSSMSVLLGYVRSAIQVILTAVGIEYFFNDMKHNKKYLFASLFLVVADTFTNGGRWEIVYFVVEFFVCFSLLKSKSRINSNIRISKKVKRRIVTVILIMLIVMVGVTKARWSGDVWQHFYVYLCGCVPYFDIRNTELTQTGFVSYIYSGINGLWSLILPIIHNLTGIEFSTFYQTMDNVMTTQRVVNIADHQTFNAFITCFWYLYADFRWIGLFFGMFAFGTTSNTVYKSTTNSADVKYVAPYLIFSQILIKSIQIFPLASSMYVLLFVMMALIHVFRKK